MENPSIPHNYTSSKDVMLNFFSSFIEKDKVELDWNSLKEESFCQQNDGEKWGYFCPYPSCRRSHQMNGPSCSWKRIYDHIRYHLKNLDLVQYIPKKTGRKRGFDDHGENSKENKRRSLPSSPNGMGEEKGWEMNNQYLNVYNYEEDKPKQEKLNCNQKLGSRLREKLLNTMNNNNYNNDNNNNNNNSTYNGDQSDDSRSDLEEERILASMMGSDLTSVKSLSGSTPSSPFSSFELEESFGFDDDDIFAEFYNDNNNNNNNNNNSVEKFESLNLGLNLDFNSLLIQLDPKKDIFIENNNDNNDNKNSVACIY